MKKLISLAALFILSVVFSTLSAQTFKGTMTVNDYVRENSEVKVIIKGEKANVTIYKTKFSRMMPITVDVNIDNLKATKKDGKIYITGKGIVPTSKGKKYEKYTVKTFNGVIDNKTFKVNTAFNDKKVTYLGKQK
ncbi:MAG: hypothetical protein IJ748_07955 [Bacteroidales bacterium]|nr:hypothetical protein [Bacteroidales bacterium]